MRGRLHHLVIDAEDPQRSAKFWATMLGDAITYDDGDFVVVSGSERQSGLAFQRAPGHVAPTWPDPEVPQQMHHDVMVDDLVQARSDVLALGARHLAGDTYADPAGHPFCLIPRPAWAPPVERPGRGPNV